MIVEARICWPRRHFQRHESLWCIFWKLGRANAMAGEKLADYFAMSDDKLGSHAVLPRLLCASRFDLRRLAAAAEVVETEFGIVGVDQILPFEDRFERWWAWSNLRYCPACLREGFHSVLFQLRGICQCPRHRRDLVSMCPSCRAAIPYSLGTGERLSCGECGEDLGAFAESGPERPEVDSVVDDLIRWARHVPEANVTHPFAVLSRNFTDAQSPGLSLHIPGYHRANAFRYAADLYGWRERCPVPAVLSSENAPIVLRRSIPLRFPRLRRVVAPSHAYFALLSRHYLRLARRLGLRVRSRRTIHRKFQNTPDALRTADWLYLLARALWEQRSVSRLDDLSRRNEPFTLAKAVELGEKLHQFATQYFRFGAEAGSGKQWGFYTWANLHLWTIAFMQTVRILRRHLESGGPPEVAESAVRAFDREHLPFAAFRIPEGPSNYAELHTWPLPDAHDSTHNDRHASGVFAGPHNR